MSALATTVLRFFRDRFAAVVLAGVMLVPAAYGGILVWGYWDPYVRSDRIPAAVVNLDVPAQAADGTTIDAGAELAQTIVDSDTMVWSEAPSADAAERGLEDQTYYVVLTIPEDFSASIATMTTSAPQSATLEVHTNDAGNFLVGVLAKDAVTAVQGAANAMVVDAYLGAVYDAAGKVHEVLGEVAGAAGELSDGLAQAAAGAAQVAAGTGELVTGAAAGGTAVSDFDAKIQALPDRVAALQTQAQSALDKATALSQKSSSVIATLRSVAAALDAAGQTAAADEVTAAADLLQNEVQTRLDTAVGIATDAVTRANTLHDQALAAVGVANQATADAGQLQTAVGALNDGATQLSDALGSQLAPGMAELSGGLSQAAGLDVPLLDAARDDFAAVLSQPVVIERTIENPMGHFGDGFTAYFAGMGLFVGAVFVFLVLSPLDRRTQLWGGSPLKAAAVPFAAGAAVVAGQALLLFLVLLLVGVRAVNPLGLLATFVLSAVSFVALMQFLKAAAGLIGEFIGVILLVLQVAAGEGAYPIQTFGGFFQAINPFLPMTYTNDAVRRTIAGGEQWPWTWVDFAVLTGVTLVCFALTILAARRKRTLTAASLHPSVELV